MMIVGLPGLDRSLSSLHMSGGYLSLAVWRNRLRSSLSHISFVRSRGVEVGETHVLYKHDVIRIRSHRGFALAIHCHPDCPAGTHGCVLMPKMASSQSANPCWCLVVRCGS